MKNKLSKLPYGQGTFFKTKEDKIRYRKMYDGKRFTVYGDSEKECLKKMELKIDFEKDKKRSIEVVADSRASLSDSMYEWLKLFKYKKVKAKTYDTLEGTWKNQINKTKLGRMYVTDIESADIQIHLNKIQVTKSYSTTKKTYHLLDMFFRYYYSKNQQDNPMQDVPTIKKEQKKFELDENGEIIEDELLALSDEEIEKLTAELKKPYSPGRVGYKYGYGILFILWTFVRVGEALAIQWKDIDTNRKTLKIYKTYSRVKVRDKEGNETNKWEWMLSTPKSKNSVRTIPLNDNALKYAELFKESLGNPPENAFIFQNQNGKPLFPQHLADMLKKSLDRAGIETKINIHGLRHTGISYFIRHGVPIKVVSELAGHSDVGVTERIYYNIVKDEKEQAIEALNKTLH